MNMNSRPKGKTLNDTFKRFQRLPEWPVAHRQEKERKADQSRPGEIQFVLRPILPGTDSSGSQPQVLAE
jgi:hypothetical protein